jgi:hypothetical protein
MDTYGHLFEGSDRESAVLMDRIFAPHPKLTPDPLDHSKQAKVLMMPSRANADKNADKRLVEDLNQISK